MKKGKSILSLILVIAVTALFGMTCVLGLDLKGMGAAKNINLGLDLEGGVAQDLLDLPAIQAGSDSKAVNFNPPLLACGGVEEGFFHWRRHLLLNQNPSRPGASRSGDTGTGSTASARR